MKAILLPVAIAACLGSLTQSADARTTTRLDQGWRFHMGHAADITQDFKSGTEYFNYLTKAKGIHNEGPYIEKFDDSDWQPIQLPHDWVENLPYHWQASHSHGYKTVGWRWPETSVGWYRYTFDMPKEELGKHIEVQFDGIFRNATVWINGFYMGVEPSGYATQVYDITDYLNYGDEGKNVLCVRADASLEEGWFYEGAGIYRDVWMHTSPLVHTTTFGTFVHSSLSQDFAQAELTIEVKVQNSDVASHQASLTNILIDREGKEVARTAPVAFSLQAKETTATTQTLQVANPHLWDVDDPYLYTVRTKVTSNGQTDTYETRTGIRDVRFDAAQGFFLNGRHMKLKGVNMHQDHAGVGAAMPEGLQLWRLRQLKQLGCNAYRASHNPMTPTTLDMCDSLGLLVIDEQRLSGVNEEHLRLLGRMIERGRNHPCIILWSDGNEEWGLENNQQGKRVAASMREYTHRLDPTRMVCMANAGGGTMIESLEVQGYNYIVQNNVDARHQQHPEWIIVGTEETTACGTRGIYYPEEGRMPSINRTDTTYENIIERGWKFYAERPWGQGLFYWTGFDYRGEPNPLGFPAVGSQFGILDYCGFPKDEAFYLKAWWTDEPVLHIFPHWNLQGHEGETVSVWAYSNCDEVELRVNGKSLGRKPMPENGHLAWDATYQPGRVEALGYRGGKRVMRQLIETTGEAAQIRAKSDRSLDLEILSVELLDAKRRLVPTACNDLTIQVTGPAHILGVGNGDSAFKGDEHPQSLHCQQWSVPAFNGLAQIIIERDASAAAEPVNVTISGDNLKPATISL